MPTSTEQPTASQADALQDLVDATYILFNEGVPDAFGHGSSACAAAGRRPLPCSHARHGARAGDCSDVLAFNLDADPVADAAGDAQRGQPFPGCSWNASPQCHLSRGRPDVMAVVHNHSPAVIPSGVVEKPLKSP
ncbi:hypothetical protein ACU4GD_33835 [Cupriavidus basilensis]